MLFLHKFYPNKRDFLHTPFPVLCISFTFVWPVNHYCLRNLLQPDKSFQCLQGWFSIRSGLLGRLLKLLVRYKVTGEIHCVAGTQAPNCQPCTYPGITLKRTFNYVCKGTKTFMQVKLGIFFFVIVKIRTDSNGPKGRITRMQTHSYAYNSHL